MTVNSKEKFDGTASRVRAEGWVCDQCNRVSVGRSDWSQLVAIRCCSKTRECSGCGERTAYLHSKCSVCQSAAEQARYEALPTRDWDGSEALYLDGNYFYDGESLVDHLSDAQFESNEPLVDGKVSIEGLELYCCDKAPLPRFDIDEFLETYLDGCEDFDLNVTAENCRMLEKQVDAWVDRNVHPVWEPDCSRAVSMSSLLKYLDLEV